MRELRTKDKIEYQNTLTNGKDIGIIREVLSMQVVLDNGVFVLKKNVIRIL